MREALIAADAGWATATHDPTEGGLATGLWELAQPSHIGLLIDAECIPFDPSGVELCTTYGLDPMGMIASGSLLIAMLFERAHELIESILGAGIACTAIGRVVPREDRVMLIRSGQSRPLARFETDEIMRLFG